MAAVDVTQDGTRGVSVDNEQRERRFSLGVSRVARVNIVQRTRASRTVASNERNIQDKTLDVSVTTLDTSTKLDILIS